MRWFKHLSNAHNDECMSELLDEFGAEGYGVWWIILEKIASQMDKSGRCFARYSVKKWAKSCGVSAKKFQKTVSFLSKLGKFSIKVCEKNSDFLIIECLNLLKFRDEYTKKSRQTPDTRRTLSGATPEQEAEAEAEAETETEEGRAPDSENSKIQKTLTKCRDILGMSDLEIKSLYGTCHDPEKLSEAVQVAIEVSQEKCERGDGVLNSPRAFIISVYKSESKSKKTREVMLKPKLDLTEDENSPEWLHPCQRPEK